jgi:hypothetical protein
MGTKKLSTVTEIVIGTILFIFIAYGLYLKYFVGNDAFQQFIREDGPVEYPTAIFLFFSSLVCIYRVFQYRKMKKPLWILTWTLLAFLFFFAAGDEISWGQRIFGIQSGEFFQNHNLQGETNLHNLVVSGKNLNIVIFSRFMFLVLFIYFVLSRLLVWKIPFIRMLVNKFQVPLPRIQHIILMLASTLFILLINIVRQSELHELSFAFIFFLILLNPSKTYNE